MCVTSIHIGIMEEEYAMQSHRTLNLTMCRKRGVKSRTLA